MWDGEVNVLFGMTEIGIFGSDMMPCSSARLRHRRHRASHPMMPPGILQQARGREPGRRSRTEAAPCRRSGSDRRQVPPPMGSRPCPVHRRLRQGMPGEPLHLSVGREWKTIASATPAAPAQAMPSPNITAESCRLLMPIVLAASRSAECSSRRPSLVQI
jgi:hypothetical protein